MPTKSNETALSRATVNGCDFQLWDNFPEGWLRNHGSTRVLVIDDQFTGREHFFGAPSPEAPPTPAEKLLRRWLNTEIVFFPQPDDYRYEPEDDVPQGTYDDGWFRSNLKQALTDPRPVSAVLLDLLYGEERDIEEASGPRFLTLLREQLPDVPVLILSNLEGSLAVRRVVKGGGRVTDVSFEDYLPKRIAGAPDLMERLTEKLLAWADLTDPALAAYSPRMRRLARGLRKIAMNPQRVPYQENNADYPRPVIITGPIGSGKNYIANELQATSTRRKNTYLVADFSGHEESDFAIALFGAGSHSKGSYYYRVRRSDAAVTAVNANENKLGVKNSDVVLSQIGILHEAHIAEQPPANDQQPIHGTVLIDEIGTAPPDMQTRLLGVFNRGKFTPYLTGIALPQEGAIDVWFLVTLSPEGQGKLRDDLRTRLEQGQILDVPSLSERSQDVIPLVMREIVSSSFATKPPESCLTPDAIELLSEAASTMQVRELIQTVRRLPDLTGSPPYSATDIRQSLERGLGLAVENRTVLSHVELPSSSKTQEPEAQGKRQPALPMSVLETWCQAGFVEFPAELSDREALSGKGRTVVGGSAAAILSFLEVCADATRSSAGYSSTRTWRFFAGAGKVRTADARTQIATLFLIDKLATRKALERSDALLWLASDVSSNRRKELRKIVKELADQPGQRDRFDRLVVPLPDNSKGSAG